MRLSLKQSTDNLLMPLPALIAGLLSAAAYPHPATAVRLIETHISWVLLAGDHAYKIKKPVNLGFLDFSDLDKRRLYCAEEVRLNRRLAPDIYLGVVAITGSEAAPKMAGDGPVLEWAVHMRAFPADSTLDLASAIAPEQIDAIADRIARFHSTIGPTPKTSPYGSPEAVMYPVRENFRQLRELLRDRDDALAKLAPLAQWSETEGGRLEDHFRRRKADGLVRECHGDLHLGNIAWVDGAALIFDCLEFNPALRHIDIVNEAAFLFMDLCARGQTDLAWRFINRWLDQTGDYSGLAGFRFYQVYRALVRAKVAAIRYGQGEAAQIAEVIRYLALADSLSQPRAAQLTLMHGYSGSGKTWVAQRLLEAKGAIRLRSDVERKRLFGLDALADSRSIPGGIYGPEASRRTLDRLLALSESLLVSGYNVIVDATFLAHSWRGPFFELAHRHGWPISIVSMSVEVDLMRQRIVARGQRANDASEAGLEVLEAQLNNAEPLDAAELQHTYRLDPDRPGDWERLLDRHTKLV